MRKDNMKATEILTPYRHPPFSSTNTYLYSSSIHFPTSNYFKINISPLPPISLSFQPSRCGCFVWFVCLQTSNTMPQLKPPLLCALLLLLLSDVPRSLIKGEPVERQRDIGSELGGGGGHWIYEEKRYGPFVETRNQNWVLVVRKGALVLGLWRSRGGRRRCSLDSLLSALELGYGGWSMPLYK